MSLQASGGTVRAVPSRWIEPTGGAVQLPISENGVFIHENDDRDFGRARQKSESLRRSEERHFLVAI